MNKKRILIAVIVLLVVIIVCCIIKVILNNEHSETASINTLVDNEESKIEVSTINDASEIATNETNIVQSNTIEDKTNNDTENNVDTKVTGETKETEKTNNKTITNNSTSKTNNSNVTPTTNNKNNSNKENTQKEESKPTNTEKPEDTKEDTEIKTEEKEETSTGNEKLANTFFSKYDKQKTQEAVNYINEQMKKDEMYEELGGYAVACTTKPTNYWISYSSNSKLNGVALAGCKVSVYVENYYRYNSKGTDYYLYDTKIYLHQEVI